MCLFMSLTCCDEESEVYNCYCAVYLSFFITYRHVEGKEKIFSFVHMKIFIKKKFIKHTCESSDQKILAYQRSWSLLAHAHWLLFGMDSTCMCTFYRVWTTCMYVASSIISARFIRLSLISARFIRLNMDVWLLCNTLNFALLEIDKK